MKRNFSFLLMLIAIFGLTTFTACNDDSGKDIENPENPDSPDDEIDEENKTISINDLLIITEDRTWEKDYTVYLDASVWVKPGVTLTIEEGVKVEISTTSNAEFYIEGDLIAQGTEDNRVTFTVADSDRKNENILRGLWCGFMVTESAKNFVLDHATVEFCGAVADDMSLSVQAGLHTEGEPFVGLTSYNVSGNVILHNAEMLYFADDAIYSYGGKYSIYNSTFAFTGSTGGEAINMKSGTTGDICYNLFYHIATNGPKLANSKTTDVQCNMHVYNNTILNGGWRRNKAGRGGSLNIEKGARGTMANNLIVNCKYGLRIVGDDEGTGTDVDLDNSTLDYQYYYGNDQVMLDEFIPSNGYNPGAGFFENDVYASSVDDAMPQFDNYDVKANFSISNADSEFPTPNETLEIDQFRKYDFHLKTSSPALDKGTETVDAMYSSISAGGKSYTVKNSASYVGAWGTK